MTVHDVARALPDIGILRDLCRSIAMAEAVLNPDGEREYCLLSSWSETEELVSLRNGSGDELDIVFGPAGAYIRCFDHESPLSPYAREDVPMPWPGVLDSVPEAFRRYVDEPAFTDEDGCPVVTTCLWRTTAATSWETGRITFPDGYADPDGSDWLFELLLDPTPEAFQRFAEDYYETLVDIEPLRHIYALRPLGRPHIAALNPSAPVETVLAEAGAMGYPVYADRL
ncbi:hypothetical protein [Streptomyces sp. NPDC102487]|uniref:hypothetical protein n=1 Tax=Streptomyces sp. NPDC102487 TaxID=3366182 RepID=UPI0038001FDA